MIQKNGFGEMKTLRRSPRMTRGVAISNAHASKSMAKVMAMPATTPAKRPQSSAFDRLIVGANCPRAGAWHKRVDKSPGAIDEMALEDRHLASDDKLLACRGQRATTGRMPIVRGPSQTGEWLEA